MIHGTSQPRRLLVVEDEPDIGALLEYVLGREGFTVELARTGQEALDRLAHDPVDVVVLDLMLPDMCGLEILRTIDEDRKQRADGPRVIVLSAKRDEGDRLRGFELGADDYVAKPFSPKELVFRIRTVLGRGDGAEEERGERLAAGPFEIDEARHQVTVDGEPLKLTLTEFNLLADFVRNLGRVRTREALLSRVWGYDSRALSRTVDTHVRRLRSKLGPAADWIETVRGLGYRMRAPGDAARSDLG